jgi:hypothetical protein
VVECTNDEEDDHENERSFGYSNAEQSNQADHCQIASDKSVLQGPRVNLSFTIDGSAVHEQQVISKGKVEQGESNCPEPKHKRSNRGVGDGYDKQEAKKNKNLAGPHRSSEMEDIYLNIGMTVAQPKVDTFAH